jgi:hypothetical protein
MVIASRPVPGGHLMVVRTTGDAEVTARFVDDGTVRPITAWCADLALVGLMVGADEPADPAPTDTVQVADVTVIGDVVALYVHGPSASATEVEPDEFVRLVATGAARAITAGVAAELSADLDEELADEFGDVPTERRDDDGDDGTGTDVVTGGG